MSLNYRTTSAVYLQEEIKKLGPSVVGLELGVWYGYNMGHLLEECPNIRLMYGVDPYLPYQDWNRFIDQDMMDSAYASAKAVCDAFPGRADLIKCTSAEAANASGAPFDFIFIDGDHSYNGTKNL